MGRYLWVCEVGEQEFKNRKVVYEGNTLKLALAARQD